MIPDPPPSAGPAVVNIQASFRKGQTFVTFNEVANKSVTYSVYRSTSPITTLTGLSPIAELPRGSGYSRLAGTHFVIEDLGAPLANGTGLLVWTAREICACYYAVTTSASADVVLGANSTSTPTAETPWSVPGAVQVAAPTQPGGPGSNRYYKFMAWEDYATWDHTRWGYYGHRFDVDTPPTVAPGQTYGLNLLLHSAGGTGYFEPQQLNSSTLDSIYVVPVDLEWLDSTNVYTGTPLRWTGWYGYQQQDGTVTRSTEARLLRYVQLTKADTRFNVDPTRVYVRGASYGGGGAMHMAYHHPTVFAAAVSSIGWVEPSVLGLLPSAYTGKATQDGPKWEEWMNQTWLTQNRGPVAPPIVYTFNRDDSTVNSAPHAALLAATELTKNAYCAKWENGNHTAFYLTGSCDWMRFRLNEAYPAFAFAGNSDTAGIQQGQRNVKLDWSSSLHALWPGNPSDAITDTPNQFAITLKSLESDTTAMVTIRNAQQFVVAPGQMVAWSNARMSDGQVVQNGTVQADAHGLVSIPISRL